MIYHQPGNSRGNFNYNTFIYRGRDYAPHFHKNMELICVHEGTMELTVNGRQEKVSAGQAALVLSNQIHSFHIPDTAWVWVAVFSEEYIPAALPLFKGKQGVTAVFTPGEPVWELLRRELTNRKGSVIMRKACFYAACDSYLEQVALETRQEKSSFLVGQLLDWIAQHYTEDITLKRAAELFGYEYHYLSRLLNRNFAISFTGLLSSYRVEHAAQLLQTTSLSVTEVAAQSGFQSIRSFNLSFKKIMGKTPVAYRELS